MEEKKPEIKKVYDYPPPLENLDGPKYIIEIQEWEEDTEGKGRYEYGWLLSVGEYLSYDCECNQCSTMAYGEVYPFFHEALRAGIKAIDEGVGENTPFELNIVKSQSLRLA
jgi:hypothetical protein